LSISATVSGNAVGGTFADILVELDKIDSANKRKEGENYRENFIADKPIYTTFHLINLNEMIKNSNAKVTINTVGKALPVIGGVADSVLTGAVRTVGVGEGETEGVVVAVGKIEAVDVGDGIEVGVSEGLIVMVVAEPEAS